jgi:hypothetical protein
MLSGDATKSISRKAATRTQRSHRKPSAAPLQQFGRRALVNFIALMGNYAGTAALLTVFDMQLGPDQPLPLPQL